MVETLQLLPSYCQNINNIEKIRVTLFAQAILLIITILLLLKILGFWLG